MGKLVTIAIGGNSLIKDPRRQSVEDQYDAICETVGYIADIIEEGYNAVITHGNGPQVGFILRRSEIAYKHEGLHFVPLPSCVADTQGAIGFQIQQALENEFQKRQLQKRAVTVITRVEVKHDDPSFAKPTKPIGSFYSQQRAQALQNDHPEWALIHDAGRGYRRTVPSPLPLRILELDAIELLVKEGFCVIAVGGGGIPVVCRTDHMFEERDAVIDKDYASVLLASQLQADILLISTATDNVYLNYGRADQKPLDAITLEDAQDYLDAGHFADGSMGPKMKAGIDFVRQGGSRTIITSPHLLKKAINGKAGTHICLRG